MQGITHQAFCQCRRIAFSTQVGQNDIFQGIVRHAPQQVARLLVEQALLTFGQGFLQHPDNHALRTALNDGTLSKDAYFQQLLRLIYRLIFVFTVEERGVLHPQDDSADALAARKAGDVPLMVQVRFIAGGMLTFTCRACFPTEHKSLCLESPDGARTYIPMDQIREYTVRPLQG